MCGICGVIIADLRQVEPTVRRMMRAMIHRGPDDEGYEQLPMGGEGGPVVGLGFRRLSILDLSSAGHQPMVNAATGDWLIFNGEIYNFRSLRGELESLGVLFRGTSDTEVLLQALSTWGEAAVEKLEGMFAFAFYEARSRRILLARDPLGIKPLYVAQLPDRFVFASEIRAVLASGLVPDDLDVAGIAGMLAYGAVQSPRTIYSKIRSFPSGSLQWIDAGVIAGRSSAEPKRYWSFPKERRLDGRPLAAGNVREMLGASVRKHLVADVPVGVLLSAGIDSTIIASFAREYTPQVTAFTVGFGKIHGEDEVELSAATAKQLGIKHVAVEADVASVSAKWFDWMAAMDSPSIDGFNTFIVSRRLAAEGVVVGLSGLGADELFGGYPVFSLAPRFSRILRALSIIPVPLRSIAVEGLGLTGFRPGAVEHLGELVRGDCSVTGVARAMRRSLSTKRLSALGLAPRAVGLAPDYLGENGDGYEPPHDADPFNKVSRIELTHYMQDTLLRDTDTNSMHHSLEIRVPFLDLPLVNYVSALRGEVKQQVGAPGKLLLRQAGKTVLDEKIAQRAKTGFSLPVGDWMRLQMKDSCEAAIQFLEAVPLLHGRETRQIWTEFLGYNTPHHWSRPMALVSLGHCIEAQSKQASAAQVAASACTEEL